MRVKRSNPVVQRACSSHEYLAAVEAEAEAVAIRNAPERQSANMAWGSQVLRRQTIWDGAAN